MAGWGIMQSHFPGHYIVMVKVFYLESMWTVWSLKGQMNLDQGQTDQCISNAGGVVLMYTRVKFPT